MFQSRVCVSFYSSTIKELLPFKKKPFIWISQVVINLTKNQNL